MIEKLLKKAVYTFSGFFHRNSEKWMFASHTQYSDNSRYLFQDPYNPCNIRKIWIAKNIDEYEIVKALGYECYLKGSCKAIFHSLTAKYYIYTCYLSDIGYAFSKNAICINLWHGIPIKKIEFDIENGPLAKKFDDSVLSKIKHPEIYRYSNFILCPSNFVYNYSFKSAFKIDESQILKFPYPRLIFLKSIKTKERRFTFFYAPTWRDTNVDFINSSFFDLKKINNFCIKFNCLFKIKLHPNSNITINTEYYENIIFIDSNDDTNIYLAEADCLITDYSSIFFDYLIFDNPILFYVFDESTYKTENREIYSEVEHIDFGEKIYNLNELLQIMQLTLEGVDKCTNQREEARNTFSINFKDTDNKRLIDYIVNEI